MHGGGTLLILIVPEGIQLEVLYDTQATLFLGSGVSHLFVARSQGGVAFGGVGRRFIRFFISFSRLCCSVSVPRVRSLKPHVPHRRTFRGGMFLYYCCTRYGEIGVKLGRF